MNLKLYSSAHLSLTNKNNPNVPFGSEQNMQEHKQNQANSSILKINQMLGVIKRKIRNKKKGREIHSESKKQPLTSVNIENHN